MLLLHAMPMSALLIGPAPQDWLFFAAVYPFSAIGIGIALHRYFAHKSFATSRIFQFLLALMAATTFGDAIRFAGKHRLHHRHVDTERDVHTPRDGIWQCWIGSLIEPSYCEQEALSKVPDLTKYPELRFLSRFWLAPGLLLMALAYLIGGFTMVGIGASLPAVLAIHQSSAVNYFCHKHGSRRYALADSSTNNAVVALLTFGEGWHNNHHRHPRSARAGEAWWEIDMYYYVIVLFEKLHLVWNVRTAR
jgi:stearoyl-CoA desaturase (delta-9 desaturase)